MTTDGALTAAPPRVGGGRLELRGIGHDYVSTTGERIQVLDDVTLTIEPGEIVSFVGRSGCGKSTLLNILAGLLTPSRGTLDVSAARAGAESRFGRSLPGRAYITQDDRLLPWRSALANVELPLELHHVDKTLRSEAAEEILGRVGLGDSLRRRPFELSGGMRQRVAVAQALVYDPAVLLMDEPFGALDAWTRGSLHELLADIQGDLNTTTVLVTHDVFEAISLSDRVITLSSHPGRVIRQFVIPRSDERPRSHQALQEPEFQRIHEGILADLQLR